MRLDIKLHIVIILFSLLGGHVAFAQFSGSQPYGAGLIVKSLSTQTTLDEKRPKTEALKFNRFPVPIDPRPKTNTQSARYVSALLGIMVREVGKTPMGASVLNFENSMPVAELQQYANTLLATGKYQYVEINHILLPAYTPNDTLLPSQWGIVNQQTGTRVESAWDATQGEQVVIAVIDTGYTFHDDLDLNRLPGFDFITDADRARDGDGRDDDPFDEGDWNFGDCPGQPTQFSSWHGTAMAGVAAAVGDNIDGVAGIAYGASFIPVRILGRCGGAFADLVDAIIWASGGMIGGVPQNANPAQVINLSLSVPGACGIELQNAISVARANGSTVVAAAGNTPTGGINAANVTPVNCEGVIAVSAHDENGDRPNFSNLGDIVDVSAPGVAIEAPSNPGLDTPINIGGSYVPSNGTSAATAFVSGSVALLYAANPNMNPNIAEARIRENARPFLVGSNCNEAICGEGMLDISMSETDSCVGTITQGSWKTNTNNQSHPLYTVNGVPTPFNSVSISVHNPQATSFQWQQQSGYGTWSTANSGQELTFWPGTSNNITFLVTPDNGCDNSTRTITFYWY